MTPSRRTWTQWNQMQMEDKPPGVPQGWRCPSCGGIYAPSVSKCDRCTAKGLTDSQQGTIKL
jgi:uncharacterized OB-fold protein